MRLVLLTLRLPYTVIVMSMVVAILLILAIAQIATDIISRLSAGDV